MNPSFMAMMTGMMKTPGTKQVKHETSINGRAFAPGKGVQQEVSGPEKEAKVVAHLNLLAQEALARSFYPRSDMVQEMEQERDQCS